MTTQHDHLARILHLISPLPVTEVPLSEALGQLMAENVTDSVDLPAWDLAAMYGYAVSLLNFHPGTLPVTKSIPAGHQQHESLLPGEAAAIMTGAPVPDGADTVIPLEHFHDPTQDLPNEIHFEAVPEATPHIRRRAEGTRAGAQAAAAGTVLRTNHIRPIARTA